MNTIHPNMLNEYMSCQASETENIKIGLCATRFVGSDRYAYVVTDILGPKKIRVTMMDDEDYKSLNFQDKIQYLTPEQMRKYITLNEDHTKWQVEGCVYTYRKNHRWVVEKQDLWGTGAIHLGHAENYLDPSF